jgi:hypothetical protein
MVGICRGPWDAIGKCSRFIGPGTISVKEFLLEKLAKLWELRRCGGL